MTSAAWVRPLRTRCSLSARFWAWVRLPYLSLTHLDVEAYAPTAAPHAVVCLDQPGKRWSRARVKWPNGQSTIRLAGCCRVAGGHAVTMPACSLLSGAFGTAIPGAGRSATLSGNGALA
jgi:hypothetical protein